MISTFTQRFWTTARQSAVQLSPYILAGAKTSFPSIQRAFRRIGIRATSSNADREHIVVALGDNALLRRKEKLTTENLRKNIAKGLQPLHNILNDYNITLVHGNIPQVGLLVLQSAEYERSHATPPTELDVLDAETEGMIGYLLEQEIHAHVPPERGVATILTQMVVDPSDPAFQNPTKLIGPLYTPEEAQKLKFTHNIKKAGKYYRRAVPSPRPVRMVDHQFQALEKLTDAGCIVICAGGGGIPVMGPDVHGRFQGVEAVIDKDRSASWIASALGANGLIMLTDNNEKAAVVELDLGKDHAHSIRSVAPPMMTRLLSSQFPPEESMAPKVEAAIDFVTNTGGWAAIGSLNQVDAIVCHEAGTRIEPHWDGDYIDFYEKDVPLSEIKSSLLPMKATTKADAWCAQTDSIR